MTNRSFLLLSITAGLACVPAQPTAQAQPATQAPSVSASQVPERAIRRDIPLTNQIRRAMAEGTRDSTGRPGPRYWQLWIDYTIAARLDAATSRLTGRETAVIHNNRDSTLSSIVLRLDQNIFRPTAPRAAPWTPSETTDGMVVTRLLVDGQTVDLAATGPSSCPAAGQNPPSSTTVTGLTRTSACISLARPVPPRATVTLEIDWNFKLAGGPAGSGHRATARWADSLYQVTQWYPRVAVYDDLRGWDTELYLGPSEFYNNFGRFDVRIDVPSGWIVGATGVLQNPQQVLSATVRERLSHVLESDSVRTIVSLEESVADSATTTGPRNIWHFVADSVNDFAWGAARNFVWTATRATIPGKGAVPVHLLFLPGRAPMYANAAGLARHALEFYSKLWMPYAFPQMTLLDGPDTGMEYPMVIMSNQGAADHEVAHSWWPMMVSNNETWYGFMDEGFNQYMNILSAADRRGQAPSLDGLGQSYGQVSGSEAEGTLMWNANYGGSGYGFQAYQKAPLMLSMLGGIAGDSAVWTAMSEYATAWRFKHPSPWDYMFFMSNALKQDLGWFWYYWLFTTESVEGSIQNVATTGSRTTVTVRQDGQMPSPVVLRVQFDSAGPEVRLMPNSTRVDANTVDVTFPVDVWFGGSRTFDAVLDFGGRRIQKVTLDPRGRFPDRNPGDNVWPRVS